MVELENACCAAWKKKYTKLAEKYAKVEELKNKFRDCTSLVNEQYSVIEKENSSLKQAFEDLKVQADGWKNEKEQHYDARTDLENEVSALKDEIQLLHQNGKSDKQLQECLNVAEKEINQLKEHLEKERCRANLEKKNFEVEKKKANDTLKKMEKEKIKVSETQKAIDVERKRTSENKLLSEKLKTEIDALKSKLDSEKFKSEAANKKLEEEKLNTNREMKRADLAMAKVEEQQKRAVINLNKAKVEKDRADDLDEKLKEERRKSEKLEDLRKCTCHRKLIVAQAGLSNAGRNSDMTSDLGNKIVNSGALMSQGMGKMFIEIDQNVIKEKKRADSDMRIAKQQRKLVEEQKMKAIKEKHRADQLFQELEDCKMRLEELKTVHHMSGKTHVDNSLIRDNKDNPDRDSKKLLKKQLKLEKMLVKHAKEATKVEILRNNMLHQELFDLKKRFSEFQLRLDKLDVSSVHGSEGIHELEKMGKRTFTREKFCTDGYQGHLVSGITSRLDPPYRVSNQKMSKSSAINSSSASFSDLPLMGSQERGDISFTASAKPRKDVSALRPTISSLSGKTIVSYTENAVTKAEKSIITSLENNAHERKVRHREKRKIFSAAVSVEKLYSKGQRLHEQMSEKLSVLHDIFHGRKDNSVEKNVPEISLKEQARPLKRRKTSCEGTDPKVICDSDIADSAIDLKASPPGMDNIFANTRCIQQKFDEIAISNHMKLLDLDNAADEKYFRIAIARPLSPTLPDIKFLEDDALEADMLIEKSSQEKLPNVDDNLVPTSGINIIDMNNDPLHLTSKDLEIESASDACFNQIQASCGKLGMLDTCVSTNKETQLFSESCIYSLSCNHPKFVVLALEIKDNHSILRILQTMTSYMSQCSLHQLTDVFLQSILPFLLKAEDLSSKEKACVFFSIILHRISEMETKNLSTVFSYDLVQYLDSFARQIRSALSDVVLRRTFMESLDVFELLVLIEDFLLQRKMFVSGAISAESVVCSYNINLVLNGSTMILSEQTASVHQVIAGGCLLASLCLAMDDIGFVCETSCNMFTKNFDPVVVLAVLHSFSHSCGSKYVTLQQYTLEMTVIRSLVMFLEKQALPTKFASTLSSLVEGPSKTWSCCTSCPFLEGTVSMEDVVLLLTENLQKYVQSVSWTTDSLKLENLLVPPVFSYDERTKEVSGLREAVQPSVISDENFCSLFDRLSLLEIIANFMSWEWTFDHIIHQLLRFLESCTMESLYVAIIVLLSQIGRLGADTNGYEDANIEKLRGFLSAFFSQNNCRKLSISVQFATVTALVCLIPIKFEEIISMESPITLSQWSIHADYIKKWFFCLSKKQQLSFRLYQASSQTNTSIGLS